MSFSTDIHPDAVLEALLAKGSRAQVQRTLKRLHDICRSQWESGSRDLSLATIGRKAEEQGLMKGRILYNASSRDYKELIQAWAAYAGPPVPPPPKTLASHGYLMRIDDPAIRSIMQATIAERDRLRAQVNQMKSTTIPKVDLRPLGVTVAADSMGKTTAILEMSAQLTEPEREALRKAISPEFLEGEGWHEGKFGEIKKGNRVVFLHGFATAIRRILGQ